MEQGYLLGVPPLHIEFPDMSGSRGAGWLHSFELSFKCLSSVAFDREQLKMTSSIITKEKLTRDGK